MESSRDTIVILADRPGPARIALTALLAELPGVRLAETVDDVAHAGDALRAHEADFLLLDERLVANEHVLAGLGPQPPHVEVVVLGMDLDPGFEGRARRIGALAWIAKERAEEELSSLLRLRMST